MLEKIVEIIWVEERLDSIWTEDCSIANALCGIRKIIENYTIFALVNQS